MIGGNCLGIIKCFSSIDMWYVNGEWWPALSCWVRINVTTSGFIGVKLRWLTLELPVGLWQALGGLPPLMSGTPKQFVDKRMGKEVGWMAQVIYLVVFFSPQIFLNTQKLVMKHESCLVVSKKSCDTWWTKLLEHHRPSRGPGENLHATLVMVMPPEFCFFSMQTDPPQSLNTLFYGGSCKPFSKALIVKHI